jgi:YD repeat-containing protein
VTTPSGTRTSTFDARNRLTGTTGAGLPADSYTWNPRGQLTGASGVDSPPRTPTTRSSA